MPTNTRIWHNNMKALFNFDILEIQQSYISEEDILKSFDSNKYGKDIIWFIDGNSGITIQYKFLFCLFCLLYDFYSE